MLCAAACSVIHQTVELFWSAKLYTVCKFSYNNKRESELIEG